jgi:hypothetical protein
MIRTHSPLQLPMVSLMLLSGILPVSSVALHSMELISIRWMIVPNIALFLFCLVQLTQFSVIKKIIWRGWVSGLLGVLCYDLTRIPFMYAGWDDFIPSLGGWITNSDENFWIGYLWRYLGNGAGLGLVFSLLVYFINLRNTILFGILFGIAVCIGLDIVLFASSSAQDMMFTMTPLTCIGGLIGHVTFGLVLGLMANFSN